MPMHVDRYSYGRKQWSLAKDQSQAAGEMWKAHHLHRRMQINSPYQCVMELRLALHITILLIQPI